MNPSPEFRYVFYVTPDQLDPALAFYRDVLRLEIIEEYSPIRDTTRGASFRAGVGVIEILADPAESPLKTEILPAGQPYTPPRGGFFLIEVADVDAEYTRISALGVPDTAPPVDRPWGLREFKLRDPAGNLLSLFSPIR